MKIVRVYKASDGTMFDENERGKAEEHELMIKLRGILQSHTRSDNFTPTEVAKILSQKNASVYDLIAGHRRTMASIKASETVKKNKEKNESAQ